MLFMSTSDSLVLHKLLTTVAEYKASDLHLSVGNPPMMRVDGKLLPVEGQDLVTSEFVEKFADIMITANQRAQLQQKRELLTSWVFDERVRFRAHMFYQDNLLTLSLAYIPERVKNIRELGLPEELFSLLDLQSGLVLFNGPNLSGKTTTVTALLDSINQNQAKHIITLEEPVEYIFNDAQSVIDQREVGRDALSFSEGLRSFVREDVDIFYVSRIPDAVTMQAIVRLTAAGHLVFAILDTQSSYAALQQLVDIFPEGERAGFRHQLADNLAALVTQKLVSRLDGGLVPAVELLLPTEAVQSVIRDGAVYQITHELQTSRGQGMVSLDGSLATLANQGVISQETALQHADDQNNVRLMLR